jgi:hypothetical protein
MAADGDGSSPAKMVGVKVDTLRYVFRKMTWPLFLSWMITALVNVVFGYETTSFSGVQSIPAFAMEFGSEGKDGTWALSPARASYTSSSAFAGKLVGAVVRTSPSILALGAGRKGAG